MSNAADKKPDITITVVEFGVDPDKPTYSFPYNQCAYMMADDSGHIVRKIFEADWLEDCLVLSHLRVGRSYIIHQLTKKEKYRSRTHWKSFEDYYPGARPAFNILDVRPELGMLVM